jgi:hypothetical protein
MPAYPRSRESFISMQNACSGCPRQTFCVTCAGRVTHIRPNRPSTNPPVHSRSRLTVARTRTAERADGQLALPPLRPRGADDSTTRLCGRTRARPPSPSPSPSGLGLLCLSSGGFAGIVIKDAVAQRCYRLGSVRGAKVCRALVPGGAPLLCDSGVCPQLVDRRWRVSA